MNSIDIDICLATFRGEKYLAEQVESIKSQSVQNWRILFSDDGSDDETKALINGFCLNDRRMVDVSPISSFGSATANFLSILSMASAPYVMLCDQDDVWLPMKIEGTLKRIRELESIHGMDCPLLVFTDSIVVDETLGVLQASFVSGLPFNPADITLPQLLVSNVVQGCTVMLNNAAVALVNGAPIPSSFKYHDHWLAALVASTGYVSFLNETTMLYRQHSHNAVGNDDRLSFPREIGNGIRRLLVGGAFSEAQNMEAGFSLRAADMIAMNLPFREGVASDLACLAIFFTYDRHERLQIMKHYNLIRDVDFYGKATQTCMLLSAAKRRARSSL